jgi:serine/threonine-protein kinase
VSTLQEGHRFDGYQVIAVLGEDAMGQVVRAFHPTHRQDVAVVVLHPRWAQDDGYRERFHRQAAVAALVQDPHLLAVHGSGQVEGRLYVQTELVEGEDLGSLLQRAGPLDAARAVDVAGQVARALDAAHAAGLVHGHLTPAGVLLVPPADGGDPPHGDQVDVRVTGLGIAPPVDPQGSEPDRPADVAALAALLYELLTGQPPSPAPGPPAPSSLRPGIPRDLDGVVLRGLAADPAQRWSSAGGMAAAARAVLSVSGIEVARPGGDPAPAPAARPDPGTSGGGEAAGRSAAVPVGAAVLMAALLATVVAVTRRRRARHRTGR